MICSELTQSIALNTACARSSAVRSVVWLSEPLSAWEVPAELLSLAAELGFEQECSLYFRGEKSEKIAFVDVSLYGPASPASCDKMTAEICRIYTDVLGVPADKIYVKYAPTDCWGWNGGNF